MGLPIHLIRRRAETENHPKHGICLLQFASRELNITKSLDSIRSRNEQWDAEFLEELSKKLAAIGDLQTSEELKEVDENDTQGSESNHKNRLLNKEEDHKRENRVQIVEEMCEKPQRKQNMLNQVIKLVIVFGPIVLFYFLNRHASSIFEV